MLVRVSLLLSIICINVEARRGAGPDYQGQPLPQAPGDHRQLTDVEFEAARTEVRDARLQKAQSAVEKLISVLESNDGFISDISSLVGNLDDLQQAMKGASQLPVQPFQNAVARNDHSQSNMDGVTTLLNYDWVAASKQIADMTSKLQQKYNDLIAYIASWEITANHAPPLRDFKVVVQQGLNVWFERNLQKLMELASEFENLFVDLKAKLPLEVKQQSLEQILLSLSPFQQQIQALETLIKNQKDLVQNTVAQNGSTGASSRRLSRAAAAEADQINGAAAASASFDSNRRLSSTTESVAGLKSRPQPAAPQPPVAESRYDSPGHLARESHYQSSREVVAIIDQASQNIALAYTKDKNIAQKLYKDTLISAKEAFQKRLEITVPVLINKVYTAWNNFIYRYIRSIINDSGNGLSEHWLNQRNNQEIWDNAKNLLKGDIGNDIPGYNEALISDEIAQTKEKKEKIAKTLSDDFTSSYNNYMKRNFP